MIWQVTPISSEMTCSEELGLYPLTLTTAALWKITLTVPVHVIQWLKAMSNKTVSANGFC